MSKRFKHFYSCILSGIFTVLVFCSFCIAAESDTENGENCGDYDPTMAIKFKNAYMDALREKDYERLKELKQQREEVDLWAKTRQKCALANDRTDSGESGGSESNSSTVSSTDNETEKCPSIQLSGLPAGICAGDSASFSVEVDPDDKPITVVSGSSVLKLTKNDSSYAIKALKGQKEPVEITVQSGQCAAEVVQIDLLPTVVNDLWNFPLVGDPAASDVNDAYAFMVQKCPSSSQNPINHSIDGCSGPAPQRLTERSFITGAQFEVFDKFRPGFEPIWGQERPNGVASGSSDTLACNKHDICYQTCGETQRHCDSQLRNDIEASCNLAYPNPCPYTGGDSILERTRNALKCQDYNSERTDCRDIAAWFETGLSLGGNLGGRPAFRTRQVQYCNCCESI